MKFNIFGTKTKVLSGCMSLAHLMNRNAPESLFPRKVNVFPFLFPCLSRLHCAIEIPFYSFMACNFLCSLLSFRSQRIAAVRTMLLVERVEKKNSPQTQLVVLFELYQLLE